jgi:hypothetical protein
MPHTRKDGLPNGDHEAIEAQLSKASVRFLTDRRYEGSALSNARW